ncbi:hypothetical protein BDC45DRAFT_517399 [Circinella umbellata]|nr:hypothetical protein BDC45DRAFT_517399 [Circinella umbellata]
MTHRLHVMGGLVHVRRNDQADDIIVRFNLKLTNTDHAGLFYFRQHIDNDDTINIIMHIKEEEDEIYCILLDIDIEVPSALALSKLNIATSNSNIQVDDGMYFSQGVKLDTMDGNITVTNSGAGIMELNSESGFINCTSVQQTLGEQVIAHSTYGDINFKYADETSLSSRPISEILSRQHEKTWISLTSISGMVRSSMCTEMNVLFDSLRQMRTGIFARDFGGFGYGSNDIDKMFVNTVECTKSSLGTHHRGVWGSEDDINVHIITKTGSDSSTSIIFSCCNGDIKRTC